MIGLRGSGVTDIGVALRQGALFISTRGRDGTASVATEELGILPVETLDSRLARSLNRAHPARRGFGRPSTIVALGASASRARLLPEMPCGASSRVVGEFVQENAARLFARTFVRPRVTAFVHRGRAVATIVDSEIVDAVARGCRTAGVRLVTVVPEILVALWVGERGPVLTRDGSAILEGETLDGEIVALSARYGDNATPSKAREVGGAEVAASIATSGGALAERLPVCRPQVPDRPISTARARVALVAGAVAALSLFAAEPVVAGLEMQRVSAELGRIGEQYAVAVEQHRRIVQASVGVADIAMAHAVRRSVIQPIARLTLVLPSTVSIAHLHIDSAGGTLVAIAPQAGLVIERLEASPYLVAPRLAGPITREIVGGKVLERVTVEFQLSSAPPRQP